jgi:hypothetical protein
MPNALRLETEIETFFQTWCSDWAPKAHKLFSDAVEKTARRLLIEKVAYNGIDLKWVADAEMFKAEPKFTLQAILLFERAVQARLPKVSERAIDVRKVLREQIRIARAKGQINRLRRII